MSVQEVPVSVHQYRLPEAAAVLTVALTNELRQVPPQRLAEYVLALAWVESGRGAVANNNPGNVACAGFSGGVEKFWISNGDYWRPPWFNKPGNATHSAMLAGMAPSAFRSFPTPESGWQAFAHEVARRPSVVSAAMADDPMAFALALRDSKYSPDYGPQHADTFRQLVDDIEAQGLFTAFAGVTLGAPSVAPAGTPAKTPKGNGAPLAGSGLVAGLIVGAIVGTVAWFTLRRKGKRT